MDPEEAAKWTKKVVAKSDDVVAAIQAAISSNDLFIHLTKSEKQDLVDCMFETNAASGDSIIVQGDAGDNFYVLGFGEADVFVDEKKVHTYNPGDSFGELALIYGTPRAASIVATADCTLYGIDRDSYRAILMSSVLKHRKMYEVALANVKIIQDLDGYERSQMADALQTVEYAEGEDIIRQGEEGTEFYIILDGECTVTVNKDGTSETVNTLSQSDFFGEIALITHKPRAATVTATKATTCARLDRDRFERVLGPCEDVLRRNMENYEKFKENL
mmetsp:Transcript_11120/g.33276  ORF Transcript_11120/g.33276 Transcript_11120/m.33276 type:complete len:275 (-) Transcript_11120:187-1011(-)